MRCAPAQRIHWRKFSVAQSVSLVSCSPAELTSVSIEHFKIQIFKLYLKSLEKSNHLHLYLINLFDDPVLLQFNPETEKEVPALFLKETPVK